MKIERNADDVCAAYLLERELAADGTARRPSTGRSPG